MYRPGYSAKAIVATAVFFSISCIAEDVSRFVPQGYDLYYEKIGDITLDGINDIILVLKQHNEEELSTPEHPMKRMTLILVGQKDGSLEMFRQNEDAVFFYGYDANFIDCFTEISMGNGMFSITHYGGFANRWGLTVVFSFIRERNDFILTDYSYTVFDSDALKGSMKELNLTRKELGDIDFSDFDIYRKMF